MERALYIECNAGISGDMTLGALIDLGANVDLIKKELGKLNIHAEYLLIPNKTKKSGISGTDLDVVVKEHDHDGSGDSESSQDKLLKTNDSGGNTYVLHDYDFLPNEEEFYEKHEHSSFKSIKKMIEESDLNERVKTMAINIFTVIAKAEASVHQTTLEKVVFHEVGAVDSIIDIVGTAIAIDLLKIERIFCSQVHDGTGFIDCRHGTIPVPVPAVMEMMKESDIPVIINEDVNTEMVTPTGFGILEGLNAEFQSKLEITIDEVGYGFGNRETGLFNAVRVSLGRVPE